MLIALIFGQVETVKVLGKLPKLGCDSIIFNLDAINLLPAKLLRSGQSVRPGH